MDDKSETQMLLDGDPIWTWCPDCGEGVGVDEDGLCLTCGCTATGWGANAAIILRREHATLTDSVMKLDADRDSLRAEVERLKKELGEARCSLAETKLAYEDTAEDREDLRVEVAHLKTVAQSSRRTAMEEAAGIADERARGLVDRHRNSEASEVRAIATAIRAAAKEER